MASYQSGFDPPTRPGDTTRSKRLGAYMPPGKNQLEGRSDDVALSPGKKEHRRPPATHATRSHQTALPKPSTRAPSPTVRPTQETKTTGSRFGFGKSRAASPVPPASAPELKGKSSRNVLRRKPSSIAPNSGAPRAPAVRTGSSSPKKWPESSSENYQSIESSMKSADAYNEIYTRTAIIRPSAQPRVIPELDRYHNRQEQNSIPSRPHAEVPHKLATQDLPQSFQYSATPLHSGLSSHPNRLSGYSGSGYSASPSTRFSESPGPGAYSRDTTPTSISSQSPGIVAPVKTHTPRLRQVSPATTRPPVTRRRTGSTSEAEEPTVDHQGLPALRESLNSSSSNSTVKDGDRSKVKKKAKRLSPLPPSPPPRKSSKFTTPPREKELHARLPTASIKQASTSSDGSPKPRKAVPQAQSSSTPPMRPSREGAPDLNSQLGKSMTVIQSNLASIKPSQDRRRSSLPRGVIPSPLQGQLMSPPSTSSRGPSPAPVQATYREATSVPRGLGIVPDLKPQQITTNSRGTSTRTPSPSVANHKSRFGLFSRRAKTAPEVARPESKEKGTRKGPAAGTGHEGYGRYAMRGRSTSASATNRSRDRSLSAGTSASQDSFASTRAFDPFLLERMSPVVIAGGGEIIQNSNASSEFSRSESNTSLLLDRPSMESKGSSSQVSSKSSLTNEASRTTLWPSAIPKEAPRRVSGIAPKGRRPSDSSDDAVSKPSLAFRRSIQRLNNPAGSLPLKLPKPLNIPDIGISSSMSSLDMSVMSEESQLDRKAELQRGRQPSVPKKLSKRPKSPEKPKKWNFFHRSDKSSEPQAQEPATMKVVVNNAPPRPMPHYAMMDSSDEQQDAEGIDIEDILRDAEVIDLTNEELDELQFKNYTANLKRMDEVKIEGPPEFAHLATVPIVYSAPQPLPITPDIPQPEHNLTKENAPVRPSRLPQVGRIPNVVRARPEQTSPKSFSRPFARVSMLQPLNDPPVFDKESVGLGPSPEKPSTPEPSNAKEDKEPKNRHGSGESSSSHSDFLAFSLRKNSGTTTSSSGGISYTGITAVIPEVDAELEEDEVWDEYDDLIERDDTPKVPPSTTSSHGVPFQYESYESRAIKQSQEKPKESPTLATKQVIKDDSPPRRSNTSSSVYSQEMNARLKEALTTIPSPTTPMSFTEFFSGYGDRNNSVGGDSDKKPRRGSHSSAFSRKSQSTTGNSRTSTDSRLITILEQEQNSPIQQVNLRVGSMTVSKWLTFGHVLFSPSREELLQVDGAPKNHSILVIDGLGNDDWSFYAAETYPNATFYNLSPTRPLPASQLSPSSGASFPLTPDNHQQVQYTSHLDKFPFPRDFFSTVVYRFPTACSETAYRNIIAESKRVLKPAGYLEMSMLDLDMMNMGNRARRAVRGLKVKMQVADPNTSLASASDTVLRAIGKRGFHDIKSCKVGVPVASIISPTTSTATSTSTSKPAQPKEELSLADMMKDESEAGDEGITKMVAKVGRWWFTRCYEMGVMPDGDVSRSIFNDEMLLRECEKWSTNFKLVVAYAQKPVVPRRRTASV